MRIGMEAAAASFSFFYRKKKKNEISLREIPQTSANV
jgi:hypothetical protein